MPPSKFNAATTQIMEAFRQGDARIWKQSDVSTMLDLRRADWDLPHGMSGATFGKKLVEAKIVRFHHFPFPQRAERRYAQPDVALLEVLQSIKAHSYYTHSCAMQAHGLLSAPISDIYLNVEQADHVRADLPEQHRIDAAFRRNPRTTNNYFSDDVGIITLLNGMHTARLGVEEKRVDLPGRQPATISVTNLERTLIDITVRPYYAGGVEAVLTAFARARDRLQMPQLLQYLASLKYVYPYHQALGWYLDKAGYDAHATETLRRMPRPRRFYLTHNMPEQMFDETWQLFVPSYLVE